MLSHVQDTSILNDAQTQQKFPRVASLLSSDRLHGNLADEQRWNLICEAATGVQAEDYQIETQHQLGTISLAVDAIIPARHVPGKKSLIMHLITRTYARIHTLTHVNHYSY